MVASYKGKYYNIILKKDRAVLLSFFPAEEYGFEQKFSTKGLEYYEKVIYFPENLSTDVAFYVCWKEMNLEAEEIVKRKSVRITNRIPEFGIRYGMKETEPDVWNVLADIRDCSHFGCLIKNGEQGDIIIQDLSEEDFVGVWEKLHCT